MFTHVIFLIASILGAVIIVNTVFRMVFSKTKKCKNCGDTIVVDPEFPRANREGFCSPLCRIDYEINN